MKTTVKAKTFENVMRYWGREASWTRGVKDILLSSSLPKHRHHMINQYLLDEQISKVKRKILINKCRFMLKFSST